MSSSFLNPKSSTATATGTATAISTDYSTNYGVVISVPTAAASGVEVIGKNDTTGATVEPGKSQFFPCQNLNQVLVKGSTISFGYYAY